MVADVESGRMPLHNSMQNLPSLKSAIEIAPGVHWVGAFDPWLRRFDLVLETDRGTSYNASLLSGRFHKRISWLLSGASGSCSMALATS